MDKYKITEMLIAKNRSSKPLDSIGIVCHETANPGATALNHFKYFNSGDRNASAHAFVDWEQIIQTIPWGEKAWHAGTTANSRYIGIVWKRGTWLQAYLFVKHLKVHTATLNNLLSHDDCRKRFGDTTHTDPTEFFREYGKTMDDFRKAVQEEINSMLGIQPVKKGIVIATTLNIRTAPSKDAHIAGTLLKGTPVDVFEKSEDWYRIGVDRWVSALYVNV
jgi:N-acetylmuramoyl-L-alanine amidase